MPGTHEYDVVVIGGGPMGLCAAYNCAKEGQRVLLLERFNFFNQSGSSNDLVRMFRTMYTQDFMADLARQTIALWADLEREAGQSLIWMSGLLNFGDPNYRDGPEGNLTDPIKNLDRLKMSYRQLTAAQIMREYPFRNLPESFIGIFAPDNGCINVPQVLRSLHGLAAACGVRLVPRTAVRALKVEEAGVTVHADSWLAGPITARRAILTAGAYTNQILASLGLTLKQNIWEMVYEYYSAASGPNGTIFPSMWFQFVDPSGEPSQSNLFYGFPSIPWAPPNLVRIAVDDAINVITDPADRRIAPSDHDLGITSAFVRAHCVGVDDRPNYAGTCLQTNVADNMYVLDFLPSSIGPGHRNVALFTAGWGFKFVPLIGRVLCDLVLRGNTTYDISKFAITRPGVLTSAEASLLKAEERTGMRIPL